MEMVAPDTMKIVPVIFCLFFISFHSCHYMPDVEQFMNQDTHGIVGDFHRPSEHHILLDNNRCYLRTRCPVSLPHKTRSASCKKQRQVDIVRARYWYILTDEKLKKTIAFPLPFVPWLNQTMNAVKFYYAVDPFESRYLILYSTYSTAILAIQKKINALFKKAPFFTYGEYKAVYHGFNKAIQALKVPQYFGNPTMFSTFTDSVDNNRWKTDDDFVQRRLASSCPFGIRKVTLDGKVGLGRAALLKQLNKRFDFASALSYVYNKTITVYQAIKEERLYVLYHEDHNGMPTVPDMMDKNPNDTRALMNATSPITLFMRNDDGHLKVAAIQWDYLPKSDVFTPKSPHAHWLLAKGNAELSDQDICQAKFHLGHAHFVNPVFCFAFRRHFSVQHPLYDFLKWHCEGTTPHITTAYPVLSFPQSFGHQYFSMGHSGFIKLASQAYHERMYGGLDLPVILKKRGLDDFNLDYYPFRDDTQIIWDEFKLFACKLVRMYYRHNKDVKMDTELQSFANEISADGKLPPDGARGKFIGFPPSFKSISQLETFIVRFLWTNVYHTTVNYPLAPIFVPMQPPKLYKDKHPTAARSYPHNLPDSAVTVGITGFTDLLSNFRANRIMDYYDKVQDRRLSRLVRNTYGRFHSCVQRELASRNAERKKNNMLGFQFVEPKWLTNSVHI